jgi:RHS repeat-associated protein
MAHRLLHDNRNFVQIRNVAYTYDQLNRLTKTDDFDQDYFDESFAYDAQGRIAAQRRYNWMDSSNGGEYTYYDSTNRLKSVAENMGGTGNYRIMSANDNFAYDRDGNLVEDKSKQMKIAYDWRGMPVEFARNTDGGDSLKLVMKYDGAGRRISKTLTRKVSGGEWDSVKVTHYTGIGTEVREEFADSASETKVVVNMPQGLGRYGIDRAEYVTESSLAFELYLKNHLGSTMAVYRTTGTTAGPPVLQSAFDYRSFGEKIDLTVTTDKVTENFTGKELDDETELGYWGARYLDLMLGLWTSVDGHKEFYNSYSYGPINPINGYDEEGNIWRYVKTEYFNTFNFFNAFSRIVGEITRIGRITVVAAGINEESLLYSQRYIYHQWESLPNEDNLYQNGTIRKVLQTYIEKEQARRDFYNRNPDQVGVPQLWSDKPYQWAPLVPELDTPDELNGSGFGVEYIEPDYIPDGNVDIGPIEIE